MNLRKKIKSKKISIGSWITIGHHSIAEIMSIEGFDWLAIDMEHSPISYEKCQELILTIKSKNISPFVRVSKNNEVEIKKAMDSGAEGIIVPMINSKKDAIKAVSFTKYPPDGNRGVGLARAQGYGDSFEEHNKWQKDNIVIIAQIEHINAVKNIKEIINVKNIDSIIIGPYDLSASMGLPGDLKNTKVLNAIYKIEKICNELSFPIGYHIIEPDYEELIKKINKGYSLLGFSLDFMFLRDKVKNEIKNFIDVQE